MSKLLQARDVADLLAVPVSWVRDQTRQGRIPCVTLGRYRRYDEGEIRAWLKEQTAR